MRERKREVGECQDNHKREGETERQDWLFRMGTGGRVCISCTYFSKETRRFMSPRGPSPRVPRVTAGPGGHPGVSGSHAPQRPPRGIPAFCFPGLFFFYHYLITTLSPSALLSVIQHSILYPWSSTLPTRITPPCS